jgi:hypothetical protein
LNKHIIRTSDRLQFKKCRRAWDIGSKIRQDLEPIAVRIPLEFGTQIHAALEHWYDPEFWGDHSIEVRKNLALEQFKKEWFKQYKIHENSGVLNAELQQEYNEHYELGLKMIENYVEWSQSNDKGLTPVYTEIEFEVPIKVPRNSFRALPQGFSNTLDWNLQFYGAPVFYQGRIDLVVRDSQGRYWLVDHKTAGRLEENTSFLTLDEQMKSYAWAIQKCLGIKVAGVLYNELYKGVSEPPALLQRRRKGCAFSTSKSQDTDFETALKTFKNEDKAAFKAGLYDDYLTFLKEEGRTFIRRTPIMYTQEQLEILGDQICEEAIDMLNDPSVYPNPNKFGCRWCDHRAMCIAMNDGQDVEWMQNTIYTKRTKNKTSEDKVGT